MPRSPKPPTPLRLGRGRTLTVRLIVRRVKDARYPDALFPVWRYHPFVTNSDAAHRRGRHHPPPPRHRRDHLRRPDRRAAGAYPVGAVRRQLRLAGLRGDHPQPAARRRNPRRRRSRRGPRRHPAPRPGQRARPASPPRPANPPCTCPPTGPGKSSGKPCGTTSSATRPRNPAPPDPTDQSLSTPPPQARPEEPQRKSWYRPADHARATRVHAPAAAHRNPPTTTRNHRSVGWPGGIAPPGSHRSRRDSLPSPGSCHPGHQTRATEGTHTQCANSRGYRTVIPCQHWMAFFSARNRLYF